MRAPQKSHVDGIVREIVTVLARPDEDEHDRLASTVYVQAAIGTLQELDKVAHRGQPIPVRGKQRDNTEELKAIRRHLKGAEQAIKDASPALRFMLFSNEPDVSNGEGVTSLKAQRKTRDRIEKAVAVFDYLLRRCDYLLTERPGEHGSVDFRQRRCATQAWRLLKTHRKRPADGTATSLYGEVASLLYAALTGERGKDLERACRAVLRQADAGEFTDRDGPVLARGKLPDDEAMPPATDRQKLPL